MKFNFFLLGLILFLGPIAFASEPVTLDLTPSENPELAFLSSQPEYLAQENYGACIGIGGYCGSTKVCCPGLKCVPSGSVWIGAKKCLAPKR
jgi:hypothetical protein